MAMLSSQTFLKKPHRGAAPPSDVRRGTPLEVGSGISQCLRVKGFCVINDETIPQHMLDRALDECEILDWYQPAMLIQEGLLGAEGSNRICRREPMGLDDPAPEAGDALGGVDHIMLRLAEAIGPYQEELGFRCTGRSAMYLHQAGEPEIEEAELSDADASDWSAIFLCRKIMMIVFLGPGQGSLELQPYDDDANSTEVTTEPGLVVILRTDQLKFKFTSLEQEATHAATTFLLQNDILRLHPIKQEEHATPVSRELDRWINSRIREIKEAEPDDPEWDKIEAPRHWIHAANRTWFKRQTTVVRGCSLRQPVSWEPEVSFLGLLQGCDVITDIPFMRWDHSTVYDAAEDAWTQQPPKTNCRHVGLIDGVDLFDNKLFGLGLAEVKGMDPNQRMVLECTYDALYRSGMRKKDIQGSTCGMYVGTGMTEWNNAEKAADMGIYGATGGSPAIMCGRLSFCLGCKGASIAIDAEAASGLACTYWAAESVEKKGKGHVQDLACAISVHLCLAKAWWPAHSAAGFLCPAGRCFSFDATANGHVRGEGAGTMVVRNREVIVDGEEVQDSNANIGTIVGGSTSNSGKSAGMFAPNGPAEQAVLVEACRRSGIMPLDVDAIECHASGKFIADAVEVASCAKALRPHSASSEEDGVLQLTAMKTLLGNSVELSGLAALMKTLYSIRWGTTSPNIHLNQLNPHLELQSVPVTMGLEVLDQGNNSVFIGVSSYGFGGTHVHMHCYGSVDEEIRPPPEPTPEDLRPRLAYWPSGGGDLGSMNRPRRGFFILGTWNSWQPEQMEDEGEGCYGFTLVLSENRWEQFQLCIDGSDKKILHPSTYKAAKGTEVVGPVRLDEAEKVNSWFLDARDRGEQRLQLKAAPGTVATVEDLGSVVEWGSEDRGLPGDRYRIRLHIAGKWRTVTWAKLEEASTTLALPPATAGRYFVAASWSGYSFEEMSPDESTPGLHTLEVTLRSGGGNFQIVRNADWHQTIYPSQQHAGPEVPGCAPDDRREALSWFLSGMPGDVFKIEFQRSVSPQGREAFKVSWTTVRRAALQ